jgi:hypothetical protein
MLRIILADCRALIDFFCHWVLLRSHIYMEAPLDEAIKRLTAVWSC